MSSICACDVESLIVTIESKTPNGMNFSDFSDREADVLLTLSIPSRLLYHWQAHTAHSLSDLTHAVNSKIKGAAVKFKKNDKINERLRVQASKVTSKVKQLSGRKRMQYLDKFYHMYVLEGDCESFDDIEHEIQDLNAELREKEEEIHQLLQEMAHTVAEYEDQIEFHDVAVTENRGKTIEEVSPRQARRKMHTVTDFAKKALWFAESFGLIPECVQLHKAGSGSPVKVHLNMAASTTINESDEGSSRLTDHERILQILYIVDRFSVSDEAYHELSSLANDLPPLYKVKRARLSLNKSLTLMRFGGPYPGAFRPLLESLTREISNVVNIL